MLESILSRYDEVHGILEKRKDLKYLYAVDKDTLFQVVNFLEHFRVASEKACSDSRPTLHFVLPLYQKLLKICDVAEGDIEPVKLLKARAKQALPQKVRLDVMHDVAVFLNPCMKILKFVTTARKKAALEKVRLLIVEVSPQPPQSTLQNESKSIESEPDAADSDDNEKAEEPEEKRVKVNDFSDMYDTDVGDGKRNELSDYVNMKVTKDTDILHFWRESSKILPNMFLVTC